MLGLCLRAVAAQTFASFGSETEGVTFPLQEDTLERDEDIRIALSKSEPVRCAKRAARDDSYAFGEACDANFACDYLRYLPSRSYWERELRNSANSKIASAMQHALSAELATVKEDSEGNLASESFTLIHDEVNNETSVSDLFLNQITSTCERTAESFGESDDGKLSFFRYGQMGHHQWSFVAPQSCVHPPDHVSTDGDGDCMFKSWGIYFGDPVAASKKKPESASVEHGASGTSKAAPPPSFQSLWLLMKMRTNPASLLWFYGQVAHFLWRLRPQVHQYITGLKKHLGNSWRTEGQKKLIIGIHVRRGDACKCCSPVYCLPGSDERRCVSLSAYVDAIRAMHHRYGVTTVYVATDTYTVVAHLRRLLRDLRFTVLHNSFDTSLGSLRVTDGKWASGGAAGERNFFTTRVKNGELEPKKVVLSALADLQMLAECDFLVLSDSIFSHIAFWLNYGRKGVVPPHVLATHGASELNAKWSVVVNAYEGRGNKRKLRCLKSPAAASTKTVIGACPDGSF